MIEAWISHNYDRADIYTDEPGPNVTDLTWIMPDWGGILNKLDAPMPLAGVEIYEKSTEKRIGWAFIILRDGYLDVEEFFVMPEHRNKGHGLLLAKRLLQLSEGRSMPLRLWVTWADWNETNVYNLKWIATQLDVQMFWSPVAWSPVVMLAQNPAYHRRSNVRPSVPNDGNLEPADIENGPFSTK